MEENLAARSQLDPELTFLNAVLARASDGSSNAIVWAKSRSGTPGLAVSTVARASGFTDQVIDRRISRLTRGPFWFIRRAPTGTHLQRSIRFITLDGMVSIFGQMPTHRFKDPIRRARTEGLKQLARLAWSWQAGHNVRVGWETVEPFLMNIAVKPVLVDHEHLSVR